MSVAYYGFNFRLSLLAFTERQKADGEMTTSPNNSPFPLEELGRVVSRQIPTYLRPLVFAAARHRANLALYGESIIHLPKEIRRNRLAQVYHVHDYKVFKVLTSKPWLYDLEPTERFSPVTTSGLSSEFQNYKVRHTYLWPPEQARAASDWIFEQASVPRYALRGRLDLHGSANASGDTGSHVFSPDVTNSGAAVPGSQTRGANGIRVPSATK